MSEYQDLQNRVNERLRIMERAQRLQVLLEQPGWRDFVEISQELRDQATHDLLTYEGGDVNQIARLQYRASTLTEHHAFLFHNIKASIDARAEAASTVSDWLPLIGT